MCCTIFMLLYVECWAMIFNLIFECGSYSVVSFMPSCREAGLKSIQVYIDFYFCFAFFYWLLRDHFFSRFVLAAAARVPCQLPL